MSMNYVDRGDTATKYFSDEDNNLIVDILVDWIPGRKAAIANGTKLPAIPEIIGRAVQRIVEKTSTRYNYRNYPFREDMVGDAILNIMRYLHTFDVSRVGERSGKINFFSWVTMCADRSFSKKISEEEGQTYLKLRAFEEVGGFAAFNDEADVDISSFTENTGIAMDFRERMGNYEEKRERQRTKEREKTKAQTKATKQTKIPKGFALYLSPSNNTGAETPDAELN